MIDQDAQGKTKCSSTTHLVAVASTSRRRSSRSSLMEMELLSRSPRRETKRSLTGGMQQRFRISSS
jgi:hypothetical protein